MLFVDFAGYRVRTLGDVEAVREEVARVITSLGDKVDAVINYDGCSIDPVIAEAWFDMARDVQTRFDRIASRHSTSAFMRPMLGDAFHDPEDFATRIRFRRRARAVAGCSAGWQAGRPHAPTLASRRCRGSLTPTEATSGLASGEQSNRRGGTAANSSRSSQQRRDAAIRTCHT
jgi:hypothetical protein